MLVLTRKLEQSIMIGNDVEIKVLDVRDGVVKLGIQAPRKVVVHRKEVFEEIAEQNKQAMQAASSVDLDHILGNGRC
jgi:carbon storage regulator